jgi:hypothetical protein
MSATVDQQIPDPLSLAALRLSPSVDVRCFFVATPCAARQRSHLTRREPSFRDRVVPFAYFHFDRTGLVASGDSSRQRCVANALKRVVRIEMLSAKQPKLGQNVPAGNFRMVTFCPMQQ